MQYLLLTASAILMALSFSFQKLYQKAKGITARAGFGYNSLLGLCTGLIFCGINGFQISLCGFSIFIAGLVNILIVGYTMIGFRLLKSGTMAIYTLFLMSGGMMVPYLFGLLFLDEPLVPLRMAALILILAGVVMANAGDKKPNAKQLILCIAVFVLNGFVSVFSKIHQIEDGFETVSATEFVMFGGFFKFIFAGVLYCIARKQDNIKAPNASSLLPVIVIFFAAAASGTSYMMQLHGAVSLPATVLYPFITGGSILFSSLAGVIFFRERLSRNVIIGIFLCFAGTIMFL